MKRQPNKFVPWTVLAGIATLIALVAYGCGSSDQQSQRERDERTRDEVARATERAKPYLEEAGRKLGEAARSAEEEAHAAAEGAKEGWEHSSHESSDAINLNSATEEELTGLPGIRRHEALKIIAARPYHEKRELVSKGILSETQYQKIRNEVTAK